MSSRSDWLRTQSPQLIADVVMYPTDGGGRKSIAYLGWGCPCTVSTSQPLIGWDAWPLLDGPLAPGDRRRIGFVFSVGEEAAQIFKEARKFYLWEGKFIGEAVVVA